MFFLSVSWSCPFIPQALEHLDFYYHEDARAIWFKYTRTYNIAYFKQLITFFNSHH